MNDYDAGSIQNSAKELLATTTLEKVVRPAFNYNANTQQAHFVSRFGGELLTLNNVDFVQAREIALAIGRAESLAVRATRKSVFEEMYAAINNVELGG